MRGKTLTGEDIERAGFPSADPSGVLGPQVLCKLLGQDGQNCCVQCVWRYASPLGHFSASATLSVPLLLLMLSVRNC